MAATSSNKVNKQKHKKARRLLLDELSVVEDKQDIFFQLMCDVHTGNICKKNDNNYPALSMYKCNCRLQLNVIDTTVY